MVVQRRPGEVQAEVPTSVYALDLNRLGQLLSIPEEELLHGFQTQQQGLSRMQGVVVDAGEDVPFEAVGQFNEEKELNATLNLPRTRLSKKAVKQVLLTAAVRPESSSLSGGVGAPATVPMPKCLIPLGGQPLIGHILTQLYASGMDRVVISIAAHGNLIKDAVKKTPFYSKMCIEFLDLGNENRDCHARSILAAKQHFRNRPFLIHTSDHIFDKSIITKLAHYELNEAVACVLVETDVSALVGLPETAVRVQLGKEHVLRISRTLTHFDAVDAGLFLSSTAIFGALEDLAAKKEYFSLADALDYFTKFNKLTYIPTAGETWFSIETEEQLAYTQDSEGTSVLSPWTVFLASTPQIPLENEAKKTVVIGISNDTDSSLRVARKREDSFLFDGFVVPVGSTKHSTESSYRDIGSTSGYEIQVDTVQDNTPLLHKSPGPPVSSSGRTSRFSRNNASLYGTAIGMDDSFILSFPVDDETSKTLESITSTQRRAAYLIEMSAAAPGTPSVGSGSQYMLAVPGKDATMATPKRRQPSFVLPSDITEITMETKGYDESLEVTMHIKHKVPLIGYVLLLCSLMSLSSVGVALDVEGHQVSPMMKLFWRQSGTCFITLMLSIVTYDKSEFGSEGLLLPWHMIQEMVFAGMTYALYLGTFCMSLSYTSVGHATLFNNAHSLLIVFVKLLTGQPIVMYEGLGAAVGVIGGGVTTMDGTVAESADVVSPALSGDLIALFGALGGAAYFMTAKKLRPKMRLFSFMSCLTATSLVVLLAMMVFSQQKVTFSTDPEHGLFGWFNFRHDRLPVELYLVLVCDLVGTMGYVSVLKYFDPIVVSVVCLVEPIVANALGIFMGVDSMPGTLTFFGATLVIIGTMMVIMTQQEKTEHIDATEAIRASIAATPKSVLYSARHRRSSYRYGSYLEASGTRPK